jgi:hypothetical protein
VNWITFHREILLYQLTGIVADPCIIEKYQGIDVSIACR